MILNEVSRTLTPKRAFVNIMLGALKIILKIILLVTNDMSGIVAHNLSGLGWSPLEVTDEMDRDATGDPEDAI